VAERIQATVDDLHGQFVGLVAEHRGLSPAAVYATEADVLLAPAAVELGLADEVMPAREAVAAFREYLSLALVSAVAPLAGDVLSTPPEPSEEPPVTVTTTTRPAPGAVPPAAGTLDTIRREVHARYATVLASADAQGPLAPLAQHLLATTELGTEDIAAALAVAKGCKATAAGHTDFASAMARLGNPNVGADDGAGGPDEEAELQTVLRSFRQREGRR
jgi:ClpP class serine protease